MGVHATRTKVIVKTLSNIKPRDETKSDIIWIHVCYMDTTLYLQFLKYFEITRASISTYIAKWVLNDFGIDLTMAQQNDYAILRELVKDRYKKANPKIYYDSMIDRQGWLRVWLTDHFEKELKQHGQM